MGLWDRDYWRNRAKEGDWKDSYYDPKQFRGGRRPGRGSKGAPNNGRGRYLASLLTPIGAGRSSFWSLVVWLAIGGLIWNGFHHGQPKQWLDRWFGSSSSAPALDHPKNCVEFPPSETIQRLMDPGAAEGGRRMTKVEIANHHNFPVVAVFGDLNGAQKFQAVAVGRESVASLQMPVGQYDLILHAGEASSWCNLQRGFAGGASVQMNGGIVVRGMATTQVALKSTANTPDGFSVTYSAVNAQSSDAASIGFNTRSNDVRTSSGGSGELRLTQTKDGHYFSGGAVNGFPVVFMVDTGATNVAISSNTAARAGIKSCVPQTFSTANGSVQGCKAIVEDIVFGTFRLSNVEVAILPNMQGEALLGMNALRRFRLEQSDGVLTLTTR